MDKRIKQSPILITGCARSGTSMVAGCIDICGGFGGKLIGPTTYNKKGYFENHYIRESIEKRFLKEQNLDVLGQKPLADTSNLHIPRWWRKEVENIMIKQGYKKGPWFYKGAKACQIWPVWDYAFPNAKWVIVRRDSDDIAASCMETAFMRAYDTHAGWLGWVDEHKEYWKQMHDAGLNIKSIWPERMLKGDYEQIQEVIDWLGLEWRSKEVIDFLEPKLWNARKKKGIIK
jgi:hypothetical protein